VIILKGKVKDIEDLANRMTSLKGVKLGRLNVMSVEEM
jgi:metal-responsive CopG/Arc/MetJ family transcriptional regulator